MTEQEQREMESRGWRNLFKETLEAIRNSGHVVPDVVCVFESYFGNKTSWEAFVKTADKYYYPSLNPDVNPCLVIEFKDGSWLERDFDDYTEWWHFRNKPISGADGEVEIFRNDD